MMGTASAVLSRTNLKQHGREWRGNSPLRPGSDSNAFTLTIDDEEHGAWIDHVSQDSGSLYDLAQRLGVELPKVERPDAEPTKRGYTGLTEYAKAHGVEAYVFQDVKWREGELYGRRGLIYPTQSGERIRFIDGAKPYYMPLKNGYRNCWYGLKGAVERAKTQGLPLVICNGEPSVVVASYYGLPACAVTGGEKALSDDLLAELKRAWSGAVVLAYDCDDTGRKAAADVALQLSDYPVKILDLGFGKGGDLADFCKLHGDDAYNALWKLQTGTQEHKPPVEQLRDSAVATLDASLKQLSRSITSGLNAPDLEQLTARVQAELNRVLTVASKPLIRTSASVASEAAAYIKERFENPHKLPGIATGFPPLDRITGGLRPGTVTVFYGATSMGKSTMVASVFRNLYKTCAGLIVSTEMEPKIYMINLAAALCKIPASDIDDGRLSEAQYASVQRVLAELQTVGWTWLDSSNPNAAQLKSAVLDAAQTPDFKLVIVDSISNMFNAGEYAQVVEVNNTIQQLARATKAAFLLTSQVSRDMDKRPIGKKIPLLSDAYGGGVIENNADTVAALYRHQYYIDQGLEEVDERFPADTGALILRKTRGRGGMGKVMKMVYIGGAGFYPLAKEGEAP